MIGRREFIIALGVVAWPPMGLAQQVASRIVGVLFHSTREASPNFPQGQRRLAEMGYVEGRNLVFEYRMANNQEDQLAALAGDLVQRRVDAIVVFAGPPIVAAKAAPPLYP